jgi:DNA invertase Pin-like site-specific DNA recombinase
MSTFAYIRVSTNQQILENQKFTILNFAHKNNIKIDHFVEVKSSTRENNIKRKLDILMKSLMFGDILIVSELSRLARSVGQIIRIIDELMKKKIRFISIKENISINSAKSDIQTKMMITLFGLFAEIERDLISERTKEALQVAKKKGKILGRPKGSLGQSKLDGKEAQITDFLKKRVSKSSIAKIFGISRTTLCNFIKNRKLDK